MISGEEGRFDQVSNARVVACHLYPVSWHSEIIAIRERVWQTSGMESFD